MFAFRRTLARAKCLAANVRRSLMDGDDDDESGASQRSSPKAAQLFLAGVTDDQSVTIAVAGYLGVGKTSFVHKCAGMTVGTVYNSTEALQRFGMRVCSEGGGSVDVTFIDVADGSDAADSRLEAYGKADAFIIMFDLTSFATMHYVKTTVFPEIMRARDRRMGYDDLGVPCMLLGNKLDLACVVQGGLALREISQGQAGEVADVI